MVKYSSCHHSLQVKTTFNVFEIIFIHQYFAMTEEFVRPSGTSSIIGNFLSDFYTSPYSNYSSIADRSGDFMLLSSIFSQWKWWLVKNGWFLTSSQLLCPNLSYGYNFINPFIRVFRSLLIFISFMFILHSFSLSRNWSIFWKSLG